MPRVTDIAWSRPQIGGRGFLPLAISLGVIDIIKELIPLALDDVDLAYKLHERIPDPYKDAIGLDFVNRLIEYIQRTEETSPVMWVKDLPTLLDESGPASITATRDTVQRRKVIVSFNDPPEGYGYEVYLDSVYQQSLFVESTSGITKIAIGPVELNTGDHTVRVLYTTPEGAQTLFGPSAQFT